MAPLQGHQFGIPLVCGSIIRIERYSFFELFFSPREIPILIELHVSYRVMGFSQPRIQCQRLLCGETGALITIWWRSTREEWQHYIRIRQAGISRSKVGITRDGLL